MTEQESELTAAFGAAAAAEEQGLRGYYPRATIALRDEVKRLRQELREAAPAGQAEAPADDVQEWSGPVPFITTVQNAAEDDGQPWSDEFLTWYRPAMWIGDHRAAAVFLGSKFAAIKKQAPAAEAVQPQAVRLTDEQHAHVAYGYVEDHRNLSPHVVGIIEATERAVWAANGLRGE